MKPLFTEGLVCFCTWCWELFSTFMPKSQSVLHVLLRSRWVQVYILKNILLDKSSNILQGHRWQTGALMPHRECFTDSSAVGMGQRDEVNLRKNICENQSLCLSFVICVWACSSAVDILFMWLTWWYLIILPHTHLMFSHGLETAFFLLCTITALPKPFLLYKLALFFLVHVLLNIGTSELVMF